MNRKESIIFTTSVIFAAVGDMFRLAYTVKMQAEESDTAEIMLYGEIIRDSPWKWSKEDKSAAEFKKAIDDVRSKGAKKLLLRINSPGGVCTESVAMRSILATAGFDEINIRIEGMCASAATDIATLPGAHVAISEGSEYMIHNPWCVTWGDADDLEHTIERLRNIEQTSRGFYAKRTGQPEDQIKKWMDAETWFTAEQAVEYGFADEVLTAEAGGATPAAACVTAREMEVMKSLYRAVPEQIALRHGDKKTHGHKENTKAATTGKPDDIHEKEGNTMEINDITMEQLRNGNPDLYAQVQQNAVEAERARLEDIDALTLPGYEDMAAQAKADGTSALDFQRQIVAAQKKKGADYLRSRKKETDPARDVTGGQPGDGKKTPEQEIEDNAKDIAEYAKLYSTDAAGGMF